MNYLGKPSKKKKNIYSGQGFQDPRICDFKHRGRLQQL